MSRPRRPLQPVRTPDRPGPGPTPPALLRALDLTLRRRAAGLLTGDHRSTILGLGTELSQVRPYQPGDDVRRIDWNVTARTSEPHVRVDLAERSVTTWLLLDTSPSMTFGTADRRKADVAEGAALVVGHSATRRGDRLGVLTVGGDSPTLLPPRQGRQGLLQLLETLRLEPPPDGGGPTDLEGALRRLAQLTRRRGIVTIVSDFRGPRAWCAPLRKLASRHDVLALEVRDPREQELPDVGDVWLTDPETSRQLRVDTSSRALRERFAAAAAAERAELASELGRTGVDHVVLSTAGDWLRTLASFLLRRGGHR